MIALVQVTKSSSVALDNPLSEKRSISSGFLIHLGVKTSDSQKEAEKIATKISKLRILPDQNGKLNQSILDTKGGILLISQFTLCGDVSSNNRPSFITAAPRSVSEPLYQEVTNKLKNFGISVQTGFFGENMIIDTTLAGPVTIILDTDEF